MGRGRCTDRPNDYYTGRVVDISMYSIGSFSVYGWSRRVYFYAFHRIATLATKVYGPSMDTMFSHGYASQDRVSLCVLTLPSTKKTDVLWMCMSALCGGCPFVPSCRSCAQPSSFILARRMYEDDALFIIFSALSRLLIVWTGLKNFMQRSCFPFVPLSH